MSTAVQKFSVFFNSKLKVQQLAKFDFDYIGKTCYYVRFNDKPYFWLWKVKYTEENKAESNKHINIPAELWSAFVIALNRMVAVFPVNGECM